MRNLFVVRLTAAGVILGCASTARAQIYEDVGTRAQGMGGAFVAVADDATASWWNPAGLATGKLGSVVVERGRTADPAKPGATGPARRDGASGFSMAFPALAVSYYRLRISEIAPVSSTGTNPLDREDLGAADVHLQSRAVSQYGMTVGQSLGTHLVLGSTLKLLRAGTAESSVVGGEDLLDRADDLEVSGDTKTDLDAGAMAALGRARFGLTVKHLRAPAFGDGDDRFVLKRQARAGVAFLTQSQGAIDGLAVAADMDLTRTATVRGDVRRFAAGVELWLAKRRLGLRSGINLNTIDRADPTGSVGISVGDSSFLLDAALLFGSDQARNGLNVGFSLTF